MKEMKQFALERKLSYLKEDNSKNLKISILPNSVEFDMNSAVYTGYVNFDIQVNGTNISLETDIVITDNAGMGYEVESFDVVAKSNGKLKNPEMEDLVDNFQDYIPENELEKLENFAKKILIKRITGK